MARARGPAKRARRSTKPAPDTPQPPATRPGGLPLPSPKAGTNLIIADIVLRAAGGLLRDRLERGLLTASYDKDKADRLVGGRSMVSSVALWSASHLARRSPLGLAVVAGGLAAKVIYDRGKRLEAKRRARKSAPPSTDSES